MIGKLKGVLDAYGEDFVIIDVHGVGYVVHCSSRTLQNLPPAGEAATLSIETHVREDMIRLFGFRSDGEREWFRLLQTVQGVGAKVALGILSVLDPGGLAVAWVCDNAGRELVADLLLVDRLLADGLAATVTLHLKPRPYFVSDATVRDLADCLLALGGEPAGRLRGAAASGRLRVAADPFWCAPLELRDAPFGLLDADLVVLKGDLNYRRLVGDAAWPASTPFADAVQLPGPVAVLRTLKSDVLVGADAAVVARLDADTPGWRSEGSRALVQVLA